MINTIIFDIGNVLVGFGWEEVFKRYFDDENLTLAKNLTIGNLDKWNVIDQGTMDFDDYIDYACESHPEIKETVKEAILQIYKEIMPFDYATSWVKELKARGYKVYILSNYGDLPFSLSKERFDFLDFVDGALISYTVKMIKPNKDIYETILSKFNIKAENAVFLDDNINNIVGARAMGIHSIHFTDYTTARQELEELLC